MNSKTKFIFICLRDQLKKISDQSISLNLDSASTHTFTPTSSVRNLGVIFNQNLSFSDHIAQLSRSCFVPFCHLVTQILQSLHIAVAVPSLWNKLPPALR